MLDFFLQSPKKSKNRLNHADIIDFKLAMGGMAIPVMRDFGKVKMIF